MAAYPCVPFQGVRVWVPDRDRVWVGGEVVSVEGDEGGVVVRCEGEEDTRLLGTKDSLPLLRNPQMLVGANDLTTLSYLHEPAGIPSPLSLPYLLSSNPLASPVYQMCTIGRQHNYTHLCPLADVRTTLNLYSCSTFSSYTYPPFLYSTITHVLWVQVSTRAALVLSLVRLL